MSNLPFTVMRCLFMSALFVLVRCTDKFKVIRGYEDSRQVGDSIISYTENGIIMYHFEDHTIGATLFYGKEYEMMYIRGIVESMPPSDQYLFLDIGANIGTWTVPLAGAIQSYGGRVYSFEAIMDTYYFLGANVALNGLKNVETFNIALGAKAGSMLLPKNNYTAGINVGGFSISIFNQHYGGNEVNSHDAGTPEAGAPPSESTLTANEEFDSTRYRKVAVDSVDGLMERGVIPACPTFIKMDVELHEPYVLKGALKTLRRCMPIIFIELDCELHASVIIPQLMKIGYDLAYMPLVTVRPNNPWVTDLFAAQQHSEDYILKMIFGGTHVLAVRQEHSASVFSDKSLNFVQIDAKIGFSIRDYGVTRCMPNPFHSTTYTDEVRCTLMEQLPNIGNSCNMCAFPDIVADDFWDE